jgi:2-(1,2-epoxy-1,2-dihydrophenyl)acetyl-CoA isomerase
VVAFVRIGLVPDAGALFFLPRLVGPGKALELGYSYTSDRAELLLSAEAVSDLLSGMQKSA